MKAAGRSRAAHRRLRRRRLRSRRTQRAAGPGHLRKLGRAPRHAARRRCHVAAGSQGRGDWRCGRSRVFSRFGGSRRDRLSGPAASFTGFSRGSNHAGGLEGGMSNGEDIRVRGYLKPISTLRRPLGSVDFATPRAGESGVRALGCLRGARRRSCRRSHGRAYNCSRGAGKVWRRFAHRSEKKLRRILSAT